jgi:arylsulfatase A-like enzyme
MRHARGCWVLSAFVLLACKRPTSDASPAPKAGVTLTPVAPTISTPTDVAISPLDDPAHACVFGFEGTFLDFGDPNLRARWGAKLVAPRVEIIEREGATWARVRAKNLPVDFYVATPPGTADAQRTKAGDAAFLEARIRGGSAKAVSFYVNDKPVGTTSLVKDEVRTVSFKAPGAETPFGANELLLRFSGAPKASTEPLAEVDWVHLGQGEPNPKYPALLRGDAKISTTLLGNAQRALALRAGGYVRCAGWIPNGGKAQSVVGLSGPGIADAEIRLVRDRSAPLVLGTVHLEAADATGRAVSFPLPDLGDKDGVLGALELWATRATPGTRVLFGEPKLIGSPSVALEKPPAARGVVLVVFGNVATRSLMPYGGTRATPELTGLAARGIVFEAHRATTALESGAFASMMTGLSPHDHGVDDADARLPASIVTLADAAREAGIPTALFTANPEAGRAFGFDRGWSTFDAEASLDGAPAVQVMDRAGAWIAEHKAERFLVVVYARGGHPPWDISTDEQRSLEPQKYLGGLDPKHAAELLAHPNAHGLGEDDRIRAWAMYDVAMAAHDAALGRLESAVEAAGRAPDTAVIVTGDIGVDARIPLTQPGSLDEAVLWVPLVIGLPGGRFAGSRVPTPTTGSDLARTILGMLGLAPPDAFDGIDLVDLAAHRLSPFARPLMAQFGDRFALRWGNVVEMGQRDREGRLCDLSLESTCITDIRGTYPLASSILHSEAFDLLVDRKGHPPPREPAILDKETQDALRAWGR